MREQARESSLTAMTIYADCVTKARPQTDARDVARRLQAVKGARRDRVSESTMAERLERAHHLCAQLAALRPIRSGRSN